jgi:hypothetical protein
MRTNRRGLVSLALGIFVVSAQADQGSRVSLVPKDSDIRQILEDRIDRYRQSFGLVAGVIEPTGRSRNPIVSSLRRLEVLRRSYEAAPSPR